MRLWHYTEDSTTARSVLSSFFVTDLQWFVPSFIAVSGNRETASIKMYPLWISSTLFNDGVLCLYHLYSNFVNGDALRI